MSLGGRERETPVKVMGTSRKTDVGGAGERFSGGNPYSATHRTGEGRVDGGLSPGSGETTHDGAESPVSNTN